MPDGLTAAFETPGLLALLFVMALAGLVRGFTGFGTALIFVPVAGRYLPPGDVIFLLGITGIFSSFALLPRALHEGEKREVALLALGAMVLIPAGIWLMTVLPADVVRWCVAVIAVATLAALVSGWRYQGQVNARGLPVIGAGAGLIGGMTGMTGPVVILFYLAGSRAVEVVRANTILFLAVLDVVLLVSLAVSGVVKLNLIWIGLVLAVPYLVMTLLGQRLFDPRQEAVYRNLAYIIIAGAVLRGLPIWG